MYNFPLVEYVDRYYTYDMNIPTADRVSIGGICATQFNLLDVPVANFQTIGSRDSTSHRLRCTDDQSFCNAEPRNNFVWFWVDEPPKGNVGDLQPAQLVSILRLQDGLQKRCIVLLPELQLGNQGVCLLSNGLLRVSVRVFRQNQGNLVIVNIECILAAVHLIYIPSTRYYSVNNTLDLVMFNRF